MNTLDINEFFNLIKGKIIDNSIKANLYSEEREIELYSQNNGIVRVSQKSVYITLKKNYLINCLTSLMHH